MARKQITISVPETMQRYIENRVNESGFGTVSEYFRNLVREDRQKQLNRTNSSNAYARRAEPVYRPLVSAARRSR